MNTYETHFRSELAESEKGYISISLEPIMNEIRMRLDIIEVAKGLGLKLRKLPKNRKECADYINPDTVYISDCPRCGSEGELRFFDNNFGCLSCHWEGSCLGHNEMDIFKFLEHFDETKFGYFGNDDLYQVNKRRIVKFFELFPEKFTEFTGRDLNRYKYNGDYFVYADQYNPEMNIELQRIRDEMRKLSTVMFGPHQRVTEEQYARYYALEKSAKKLQYIIDSKQIVSKIYEEKDRVHEIVSAQKPEDIGLIPEEVREGGGGGDYNTESIPWSENIGTKREASKNPVLHFKKKVDHALYPDVGLPSWNTSDIPEEIDNSIEIPDMTFDSDVILPRLSSQLADPIFGNFVIAYSRKTGNFTLILSPTFKERKLHESFYVGSHFHGDFQKISEHKIGNLVREIASEDRVWSDRFSGRREENTPIIPEGYKEVATGMWVYSGAGLFLNLGTREYSKGREQSKATLFDKALLERIGEGISRIGGNNVYIDPEKYIDDFRDNVWYERIRLYKYGQLGNRNTRTVYVT